MKGMEELLPFLLLYPSPPQATSHYPLPITHLLIAHCPPSETLESIRISTSNRRQLNLIFQANLRGSGYPEGD